MYFSKKRKIMGSEAQKVGFRFGVDSGFYRIQIYTDHQGPRKIEKSVGAQVLKLTPKYLKFAFYCIFTLQFFKTCGGPGPHGPHGYEGPG